MVDISAYSDKLERDDDGIWSIGRSPRVSYPESGHAACLALEDASLWFGHRNDCIGALVNRFPPPGGQPIFDVGGGNGFVAVSLVRGGHEVVLVEPGRTGARNGVRRGLANVVCAVADAQTFRPHSLTSIGLFDVIEHVEADVEFLRSLVDLACSGARFYATVPSHQLLWSDEDIQAGHFRRYSLQQICGAFSDAGLEVEFATYFFRHLPLPILLMRTLPFRLGLRRGGKPANVAREHAFGGRRLSNAMKRLLAPEIDAISKSRPMSFGASCMLVASVR